MDMSRRPCPRSYVAWFDRPATVHNAVLGVVRRCCAKKYKNIPQDLYFTVRRIQRILSPLPCHSYSYSRVAQSSPWYPISQMQKASSPGPVQIPLWLHQFGHLPRAEGSRPSNNSMPQEANRDEARKLIPAAVCSAIAIWRIAGPKATNKCQWVWIAYSQGTCCLCCCSRAAELQLTPTTNLLCVKASAKRKNGFHGERLAFLYRDKYKTSKS